MTILKGVLALALASCASEAGRIEVTDHNDLGVAALAIDETDGLFVLHGYDADGTEVATIQRTTGSIPDLPRLLPGSDDRGTDLRIWAAGASWHAVSRETSRLVIRPQGMEPAVSQLVAIPQVVASLAERARITIVQPAQQTGERAYSGNYATACNLDHINSSPVAGQCCEQYELYDYQWTLFIRYSDYNGVLRYANPYHYGCAAEDGYSSCDGNSCYYGPNGFARAIIIDTNGGEYANIYSHMSPFDPDDSDCGMTSYPAGQFSDLNGNFSAGQVCPGGGSTAEWDY